MKRHRSRLAIEEKGRGSFVDCPKVKEAIDFLIQLLCIISIDIRENVYLWMTAGSENVAYHLFCVCLYSGIQKRALDYRI